MSITMIGLDTAKSVFQVHAVDGAGQVVIRRKLHRDELLTFFEKQGACTVAMEACGAAHHWGRALTDLGHTVRLIAPEAVRPFVKRGKKTDAAAAICEAASWPGVTFVPIKSLEQQGTLAVHAARSLLVKQQTMLANVMRGLAAEFGLTVPKSMGKLGDLMRLVDVDEAMPEGPGRCWAPCLANAARWKRASGRWKRRSWPTPDAMTPRADWRRSPASVRPPRA